MASRWIYFGSDGAALRALRRRLGPSQLPPAGALVDEVAGAIRQAYVELDRSLHLHSPRDPVWDATNVAERSPYTSSLFYDCCVVLAFLRLLAVEAEPVAVFVDSDFLVGELVRHGRASGARVADRGRALRRVRHALLPGLVLLQAVRVRAVHVREVVRRRRVLERLPPARWEQVDVVLATWAGPSTFPAGAEQQEDAYFGRLPAELRSSGLRVGYLANPLSWVHPYDEIAAGARAGADTILLPEDCVTAMDALRVAVRTLVRRFRVVAPFVVDGVDVTRLLRRALLLERAGIRQTYSLQFELVGRRIAARAPRVVVHLFENQSWEKALRAGLEPKAIPTIGYQHAPASPIWTPFVASSRDRGLRVLPDRVVAIGEHWSGRFEELDYPPERLRVGPAFRYAHLAGSRAQPAPERADASALRILVAAPIAEGDGFELVAIALEAAQRLEGASVLIKLHPAMGIPDFVDRVAAELRLPKVPDAVRVADEPLRDLLPRSDLLVYSGTSSAYEAIAYGLPVVSVRPGLWLDTDTVPADFADRNRVATTEELISCVEAVRSESPEEEARRREREAELTRAAFAAPQGAPLDTVPFLEGYVEALP